MFIQILDALLEALLDTLKLAPLLYLVYLLIEYLTHKKEEKFLNTLKKNKTSGIFLGAALGSLPQCGFSTIMADMFNHKYIGIGTLIAVFVATSDEAIPLMISHPDKILDLLLLVVIKFILALLFGFLFHFIFSFFSKVEKKKKNFAFEGAQINSQEYLEHHDCIIDEEHIHHHEHKTGAKQCECCTDNIFLGALKHSLLILLYVLVANIIINLIFVFVGEEALISALNVSPILQVLIAPIIGMIPNCVSSVVLVELFLNNALIFPALIGGLSAGSGVGLIILFKNKKNIKQNLFILLSLYIIGVLTGLLLMLIF